MKIELKRRHMKKELLFGGIGLIIGAIASGLIVANTNNVQTRKDGSMAMVSMVNSLKGKTGDDFDQAFISDMIEHHQGAIDMAKLAQQNAKHDEVKKMADDIIAAQSKEIDLMQTWQNDWNYKSAPMSHDATGH
jgi:uncharacterized protein (DUF305 family)